ncbi:MAG TPA: LuxR C-terminal-related transcriptional regulator [Acidimicrobiales bacterium]|nr:LuxR C-terminal-related transcriptional regulator [Acidimicrobiales bacterium]
MPVQSPSGTVTFLFTDIEDSARLWDASPADMAEAVQAHDAILRAAIERHRGHVFADGGDGFAAAFSSAMDAVTAAVEAQRALGSAGTVPFGVRMALHTCEAVEHDRDYHGAEVNRAARLMALAHGGQVLVSDAAAVLLRSRVTVRPLGDHVLRGLRGTIPVYQVVADGLRSEFPVLRGVDRLAGNLPRRVSSLVGRDAEVDEVAELVRSEPLVTLTGVGGVGKTRLAVEVGAELAGEFDDGVWIAELAGVLDAVAVPAALATVLGVTPQGDAPLMETVAATVAGRRMLLVIDNCEHLRATAAGAIAAILGRGGHAKVLATSREAVGVPGEVVRALSPLATEGGVTSDAVTLFVERARSARRDFELQDTPTAAAVIEICEAVDGLPLGIELAAARMSAMSAIEVRDRLADRFRLLQGGAAGPARHLTLRHAVEWSYDLLTGEEQALLRRASVFAGGFDLSSMCALVEDADEIDVLGYIDSLVRKSLVVADHSTAVTRYGLYETIRQFAGDRLAGAGERDRAGDAHADHFASRAVEQWERWNGPGWRGAVDWVERELGNLRAAFRWCAERGRVEVATDIAAHAALMGFSVELFETVTWAEELLDVASTADVPRLPRLYAAAGYACFIGRPDAARRNAHRATELEADDRHDGCEPGYSTFIEALGQVYCGDLDRYLELTGEVARRYGAERGYGLASYVDGLQSAGRVEEALALTEQSVAAARQLGNPYWVAYSLWIAGMAFSRSDPRRALAAWDEGVAFVREHRVHFFEGFLARDAARLHTTDGEPEAALVLFGDAIASFHRAGNVPQLVITLASLPTLFERLERLEAAATLLGAMSQHESSFRHVPELAGLEERLAARLGAARTRQALADGAPFGLDDAVAYAGQQIDAARRAPRRRAPEERPGGLSRRELAVLRLLAEGRASAEIASELFISTRTAEHHIQHIYTKIGVANRASATRWAVAHHVVPG